MTRSRSHRGVPCRDLPARVWRDPAGSAPAGVLVAAVLVAAAALSSCTNPTTSTGSLVVPYVLGAMLSCDGLDVETVRAVLDNDYRSEEVPCSEGQVRFEDLPRGLYRVTMFGLSSEGFPVMDSLGGKDVLVKVPGEDATAVAGSAVLLTAAPAKLMVRWDFEFTSCEQLRLDHFLIRAWNAAGDDVLLEESLDCTAGGLATEQDYREVPDPDRDVGGTLVGLVTVHPQYEDGVEFGEAVSFEFDPPGPGHTIRLSLTCRSSGGCEGDGIPDESS